LSKGRNMMEGWDVKSWVEGLGLPQYGETLVDNGFTDKEVVATLSDNDLEKIGVSVLGHRRKIMLAVAQLNENAEEKQSLKRVDTKSESSESKTSSHSPTAHSSTQYQQDCPYGRMDRSWIYHGSERGPQKR
jgi:hypothetical protein